MGERKRDAENGNGAGVSALRVPLRRIDHAPEHQGRTTLRQVDREEARNTVSIIHPGIPSRSKEVVAAPSCGVDGGWSLQRRNCNVEKTSRDVVKEAVSDGRTTYYLLSECKNSSL